MQEPSAIRARALVTTQSRAQLDMMIEQRGELQSQLKELSNRRNQLFAEMRSSTDDATRRQIEVRLREIDGRAARLDQQIAGLNDRIMDEVGRLGGREAPVTVDVPRVTVPRVNVPQITIPPINFAQQRGPDMRQIGGIMAAEAVALALIGLLFWRLGVRRMRARFEQLFATQAASMTNLQQAVDTIAVEVERISEGQRFVAKALTENAASNNIAGKTRVST